MTFMQPVAARSIDQLGYDEASASLYVVFNTGKCYRYTGVSAVIYNLMLIANSIGGFFSKNIKGKFADELIDPQDIPGSTFSAPVWVLNTFKVEVLQCWDF